LSEAPAVREQDYNAEVESNESLEAALNKVVEQVNQDIPELFCPRIEVERQADQKFIVQVLNDFDWSYQEKEVAGKRLKYWLYIDAPETPEIAASIVKELSDKSIDSFIINRGEMKNRISLGLYSSRARAEQSQLQIKRLSGYEVSVYEHMRNVSLQQIDIGQPVEIDDWERFMARLDLTKMMIKLEKNPC
jgi:hypothetical protein